MFLTDSNLRYMFSELSKKHTLHLIKNEIERLAASDHRRVTLIKFPVHSRLNCQSLKEPTVVDSLFWWLGTLFSGRCRCREV